MIEHTTYQARVFQLTDLVAAVSFAEQGGIAIHLERRRFSGPRWAGSGTTFIAYRVIGQREQLRSWARDHAQWDRDMREQEGEPGLFFFVVVGLAAQRVLAELHRSPSDVS